jgi:hypothetical protein
MILDFGLNGNSELQKASPPRRQGAKSAKAVLGVLAAKRFAVVVQSKIQNPKSKIKKRPRRGGQPGPESWDCLGWDG